MDKRQPAVGLGTFRCDPRLPFLHILLCPPIFPFLHGCYTAELLQTVKVIKGLPAEWGTCRRTVSLNHARSLASWGNVVAVGLASGGIVILDVVTGNKSSTLSGHAHCVESLAFSSDGMLLVSGSWGNTIKLWDTQTGGIVKTFHGHTDIIFSVAISPDKTTIASGSQDHTIRLWDVKTGACQCVLGQHEDVTCVAFSPTDPLRLMSASGDCVQQWDIGGHQIGPTYIGYRPSFSSDGTRFVTCAGSDATVRNSGSGAVIAKLHAAVQLDRLDRCCFSPDGGFVAGAAGDTVYVWDLAGSDPRLVETFVVDTQHITSLTFSSSVVSVSRDRVKFWQVGVSSTDIVANHPKYTPLAPAPIPFVSLQAECGTAISIDSAGVLKTWDIETGSCKAQLQTSAIHFPTDVQLINNVLVTVWYERGTNSNWRIRVWDVEKGEPVQTICTASSHWDADLKISRDGSKVFFLNRNTLQAWSIRTGEAAGGVKLERHPPLGSRLLTAGGSRVWLEFESKSEIPAKGWDFGTPGSPHLLSSPGGSHLDSVSGTKWWDISRSGIEDTVTGQEVFRLPKRYACPARAQWDGRYLIAGYMSGELLILDFTHLFPP